MFDLGHKSERRKAECQQDRDTLATSLMSFMSFMSFVCADSNSHIHDLLFLKAITAEEEQWKNGRRKMPADRKSVDRR